MIEEHIATCRRTGIVMFVAAAIAGVVAIAFYVTAGLGSGDSADISAWFGYVGFGVVSTAFAVLGVKDFNEAGDYKAMLEDE